uniref:Plasma membrane-associated cation-binding protein 1 n=1 Tax=Fagus sylvatica TaxID=28930 RepID=A0A2N9IME6_FAGSY
MRLGNKGKKKDGAEKKKARRSGEEEEKKKRLGVQDLNLGCQMNTLSNKWRRPWLLLLRLASPSTSLRASPAAEIGTGDLQTVGIGDGKPRPWRGSLSSRPRSARVTSRPLGSGTASPGRGVGLSRPGRDRGEQINKEFEEEKSELQPKVLETYEASLEEIKVFENDGDNWKAKVLPKTAKAAAAEACKFFDESKEQINKEFEEKKSELQPKVLEIYEASSVEIKTLVKEPKEAGLKKHFLPVHEFLEELSFPDQNQYPKHLQSMVQHRFPGPIFFVFEKVSTFIVTEEKVEPPPEATTTTEEGASGIDREIIIVEEEKKEEVVEKKEEEEKKKEVVEKIEEEKREVVVVEGDEKAETATTELAAKVEEAVEPPKP